jgi:hypothetical protein
MERQGYALALRKLVDDGWNAAFEEHRLLAPVATANAPTPFRAVIDAAWKALNAKPMPTPATEMVEEVLEWEVRHADGNAVAHPAHLFRRPHDFPHHRRRADGDRTRRVRPLQRQDDGVTPARH